MKKTIVSLIAGFILSASAVSADHVNLPEPRYVQSGTKVEYVVGKRFEIPEITDRWDDLRDEKVDELEKILEVSDDCDKVSVGYQGIECMDYTTECPGGYERRREKKCNTTLNKIKQDIWGCIDQEEVVCNGPTRTVLKTTFSVHYDEMHGISKSASLFNDDNVCFDDDKGESYSLDTSSSGTAAEATALIRELRDITKAIQADRHSQHALFQQRDMASQAYQSAADRDRKVSHVSDCLTSAYKKNGQTDTTSIETLHDALGCLAHEEKSIRDDALQAVKTQSPNLMPYISKIESLMK